jgi:hypothetical protein
MILKTIILTPTEELSEDLRTILQKANTEIEYEERAAAFDLKYVIHFEEVEEDTCLICTHNQDFLIKATFENVLTARYISDAQEKMHTLGFLEIEDGIVTVRNLNEHGYFE